MVGGSYKGWGPSEGVPFKAGQGGDKGEGESDGEKGGMKEGIMRKGMSCQGESGRDWMMWGRYMYLKRGEEEKKGGR